MVPAMRVFLMRHAHAIDEGARVSDQARWLTLEGRQVTRAVGLALKSQGVKPALIVSSPLTRALQTAELVAETLDYLGEVQTLGALAPGIPPRLAAEQLGALGRDVLAVGHEPGISMLGGVFAQRPSFPPFRRAQVCAFDGGRPEWTFDPERMVVERLLVA